MGFQDRLDSIIDEYLNEVDRKNMLGVSILIPGQLQNFWITNYNFLCFTHGSDFSLAIHFSLKQKGKKDKKSLQIVESTKCFNNFIRQVEGKNSLGFIKSFDANKKGIIETVNCIVEKLYPKIDSDDIKLILERRTFFTLRDELK